MVNVRLVFVGKIPAELNVKKVVKWKSSLFKVLPNVKYPLNLTPDIIPWGYSDVNLTKGFPSADKIKQQTQDGKEADLTFYIIDAPIQDNWFTRIFDPNRIVLTFHEAKDILKKEYVPFENYVISSLYFYSLLYVKVGTGTITMSDELAMVHGARRECVFDMCGIKDELPDSCITPGLCRSCEEKLKNVDEKLLADVRKELKNLKRMRYFQLALFLKANPCLSLGASVLFAVFCSLLANIIFQCLTKQKWLHTFFNDYHISLI